MPAIPRRRRPATIADSLATDLLVGAQAIAQYLGYEVAATYHGLAKGYILAVKQGDVWVSSKARLKRHYQGAGDDGGR